MRRLIAPLLCLALISGCGAMFARTGDINTGREELFTPLFSGTCFDAAFCGLCLASPVLGWSDDYEIPPYGIIFAPLPLIDLPFSFVADLFLIRHDIELGREIRAREAARTEADRVAERQRDEVIRQQVERERERERLMREAVEQHLDEQRRTEE